jgi:membrane-bound serine protease (ClpP class)
MSFGCIAPLASALSLAGWPLGTLTNALNAPPHVPIAVWIPAVAVWTTDIAIWIMLAGGLLIELEFHRPGKVVPGALGTVLLLLGVFRLSQLPVHPGAAALAALAVAAIVAESRFATRGVLPLLGGASLLFALLHLVGGPNPQLHVHPLTAVLAAGCFTAITYPLARTARRAYENKRATQNSKPN